MKHSDIDRTKWLTSKEVAEYLGVSRDWVDIRMKRGMFTTKRHLRWTYIHKQSAERMKEQM